MTKLTLNNLMSAETQARLMKLKGGTEETEKQGSNQETRSQPQVEKLTLPPKEITSQEQKDKDRSRERFYEAVAWLESTFPRAINFKDPKPLKLGIQRELLLVPSPYSKGQLRRCLGAYCGSRAYLEAMLQGKWRHDLNGEKIEELAQEHKDHALKQLEHKKTLWKKNKKYQKEHN